MRFRSRGKDGKVVYSIGLIVLLGAAIGSLASWGTSRALAVSESNDFCVSCHVMDATVFRELQETQHYKNRLGLQATCANCHLPDTHTPGQFVDYLAIKIGASRFVYGWATGAVSKPEQLAVRRAELAERVWERMRANDSRACRVCHNEQVWALDEQTQRAQVQHRDAADEGKTCVDCHDDGVAHQAVAKAEATDDEGGFDLDEDFMFDQ